MIKVENISTYLSEIKLSELEASGVDNWSYYGEAIWDYRESCDYDDDEELTAEETLVALESGGVDNWSYYGEALSDYYEYEEYVEDQVRLGASEVMDFYKWSDEKDTSDVEDMTFEEIINSEDEDHERRAREMMKSPEQTLEEWLGLDSIDVVEMVEELKEEDFSSFKFPLLYKHIRGKLSPEDDVLRAYFDTVRSLANNFNTFAPRLIESVFVENKLPHKLSEDEFLDEVLPLLVEKAINEEEQSTINFILITHGFELK